MTAIQLKSRLHELIDDINDEQFLEAIKAFLEGRQNPGDWANEISEAEKASIQRGIEQADSGELIDHEEVMKKYRK